MHGRLSEQAGKQPGANSSIKQFAEKKKKRINMLIVRLERVLGITGK